MARPTRCRRICAEPACRRFAPGTEADGGEVVLTMDEYEVLRLTDYEKRTHEQCAAQMEISRTTVTEICDSARFKLADCLVNGKTLVIAGGALPRLPGGPGAGLRAELPVGPGGEILRKRRRHHENRGHV